MLEHIREETGESFDSALAESTHTMKSNFNHKFKKPFVDDNLMSNLVSKSFNTPHDNQSNSNELEQKFSLTERTFFKNGENLSPTAIYNNSQQIKSNNRYSRRRILKNQK